MKFGWTLGFGYQRETRNGRVTIIHKYNSGCLCIFVEIWQKWFDSGRLVSFFLSP